MTDDCRDLQEIHVKAEVEVGIGDVSTVADAFDVPHRAVKSFPDFTKAACKFADFACLVGGVASWNIGEEQNTVLGYLIYGREKSEAILYGGVREE
jgi:hypothetical protein